MTEMMVGKKEIYQYIQFFHGAIQFRAGEREVNSYTEVEMWAVCPHHSDAADAGRQDEDVVMCRLMSQSCSHTQLTTVIHSHQSPTYNTTQYNGWGNLGF